MKRVNSWLSVYEQWFESELPKAHYCPDCKLVFSPSQSVQAFEHGVSLGHTTREIANCQYRELRRIKKDMEKAPL